MVDQFTRGSLHNDPDCHEKRYETNRALLALYLKRLLPFRFVSVQDGARLIPYEGIKFLQIKIKNLSRSQTAYVRLNINIADGGRSLTLDDVALHRIRRMT